MKNLEKYLIDFDTLKVGDKVWSIEFGDNVVGSITSSGDYPIKIYNTAYARDGKISTFNKFPSLFKSNPFGSISEYPKVMEVSDNEDFKDFQTRVVFLKKNNMYLTWYKAETIEESEKSTLVGYWKYAREIQPEKKKTRLTMDEIAKLANIHVKDLEIVK